MSMKQDIFILLVNVDYELFYFTFYRVLEVYFK